MYDSLVNVLAALIFFLFFIQALSEEISGHRPSLDDTVEAGRELEGYTDAESASLPDIGYTDLQRRYDIIKVCDRSKSDLHC